MIHKYSVQRFIIIRIGSAAVPASQNVLTKLPRQMISARICPKIEPTNHSPCEDSPRKTCYW